MLRASSSYYFRPRVGIGHAKGYIYENFDLTLQSDRQTLPPAPDVGNACCDPDAGAPATRSSGQPSPQHLRGYLTADPQARPVQLEFADVRDRLRCTDRVGRTGSSPVATRFTGNHGGALLTGFD